MRKDRGRERRVQAQGRALAGEWYHKKKDLQSFATLKGTNVAGGSEGEGERRGQAVRERENEKARTEKRERERPTIAH